MRREATDLDSEVILVTGAAGSIGRELVFNFENYQFDTKTRRCNAPS